MRVFVCLRVWTCIEAACTTTHSVTHTLTISLIHHLQADAQQEFSAANSESLFAYDPTSQSQIQFVEGSWHCARLCSCQLVCCASVCVSLVARYVKVFERVWENAALKAHLLAALSPSTGDAEVLTPFADNSFDAYTISFGLRNVTDIPKALRSAHRVLKRGGRIMILEFSQVPNAAFRQLYDT